MTFRNGCASKRTLILMTRKTLYVEISWDRECAELVTDERNALHERLETATDEQVAALEAVDPELTETLNPGAEAAHDHGWSGDMRRRPSRCRGRPASRMRLRWSSGLAGRPRSRDGEVGKRMTGCPRKWYRLNCLHILNRKERGSRGSSGDDAAYR